MTVLIAGGGISGLALALTCHQIGVPFRVFEAVEKIQPLGVGINVQPTAVRELYDLGLKDEIASIGVKTRDYGMYTKTGLHVWTEARGTWAGYNWPQYSVHRGKLHMMLYEKLIERAGAGCIETGWSATGFENIETGAMLHLKRKSGETKSIQGALAIGADGIHSAIRKQMEPNEGEPTWGGNIMWRGTTQAKPFKSGASMVMIGHKGLRFVSYPISEPDPQTGNATINWICVLAYGADYQWNKEDWSREASVRDFLPRFKALNIDWLDIPTLIANAGEVYEYPMVDRDPIERWTHGNVTLMGDAAHAAYPVGSNGAGSGIIDARKLGAAFLKYGLTSTALKMFEEEMRPIASKVVLMNRTAGPDAILDLVEEYSAGTFEKIEDVISQEQLAAHAKKYKAAAGYGIEETNSSPQTIPNDVRYGRAT